MFEPKVSKSFRVAKLADIMVIQEPTSEDEKTPKHNATPREDV